MVDAKRLSVVQLADAILDDMVRVHAAVIEVANHPADCYGFHSRARALFDHCEDLVELETHDGIAVGTADGGLVCVCILAKGLDERVQIAEEPCSAVGNSVCSSISLFSFLHGMEGKGRGTLTTHCYRNTSPIEINIHPGIKHQLPRGIPKHIPLVKHPSNTQKPLRNLMQLRPRITHPHRANPRMQQRAHAIKQVILVHHDGDILQQLESDLPPRDVPELTVHGVHHGEHCVSVVFWEGDFDGAVVAQLNGFSEVSG